MLRENADEPYAEQIAKEIMKTFRQGEQIDTTGQLKEVIERALVFLPDDKEKKDTIKKTCQRTFQALRIDVNTTYTCTGRTCSDSHVPFRRGQISKENLEKTAEGRVME